MPTLILRVLGHEKYLAHMEFRNIFTISIPRPLEWSWINVHTIILPMRNDNPPSSLYKHVRFANLLMQLTIYKFLTLPCPERGLY